jgi:hypothetical protein
VSYEAVLIYVFEEFRAGESVGYGGLDGLKIKSFGELDGVVDRFLGISRICCSTSNHKLILRANC